MLLYDTDEVQSEVAARSASRSGCSRSRTRRTARSSRPSAARRAASAKCRSGTPTKEKLLVSVPVTFDTLYGVSWSPDGKTIAFGCSDNTVRAVDSLTGKQVLQMGTHSDWVLGTVFSQDGLHLVSVGRDMSMKLTEVATQRFIDNVTSITPGALKGGLMAVDRLASVELTHPFGEQQFGRGIEDLLAHFSGRAPSASAPRLLPSSRFSGNIWTDRTLNDYMDTPYIRGDRHV